MSSIFSWLSSMSRFLQKRQTSLLFAHLFSLSIPLLHISPIHLLLLHETKLSTLRLEPHHPTLTHQLSHITSASNSPIQQFSTHTARPLSPHGYHTPRILRWYASSRLAPSRSTLRRRRIYRQLPECLLLRSGVLASEIKWQCWYEIVRHQHQYYHHDIAQDQSPTEKQTQQERLQQQQDKTATQDNNNNKTNTARQPMKRHKKFLGENQVSNVCFNLSNQQ
jgi:hypothetical protein